MYESIRAYLRLVGIGYVAEAVDAITESINESINERKTNKKQ